MKRRDAGFPRLGSSKPSSDPDDRSYPCTPGPGTRDWPFHFTAVLSDSCSDSCVERPMSGETHVFVPGRIVDFRLGGAGRCDFGAEVQFISFRVGVEKIPVQLTLTCLQIERPVLTRPMSCETHEFVPENRGHPHVGLFRGIGHFRLHCAGQRFRAVDQLFMRGDGPERPRINQGRFLRKCGLM